ncbi:hypothetical protein WBP07_12895 [Novosphingobium sp. BL-8A]|uniref:hypothetical protein n=1 Tax=Novosphingobium sp. BL-8A TaxID=3127639 RepID=UPI0037582FA9
MIDAIATRRTTLNGKTYAKGAPVRMPAAQFEDLKPTKRFERAPVAKKATVSAAAAESKSSAAPD